MTVIPTDGSPNFTALPMRFAKTSERRSSARTAIGRPSYRIRAAGWFAISVRITRSRSTRFSALPLSRASRWVATDPMIAELRSSRESIFSAISRRSPSSTSARNRVYPMAMVFALLISWIMISRKRVAARFDASRAAVRSRTRSSSRVL
ncbi:hypothetical protein [Methanoculleus chikugoensis]|uniref:hypothetical protein n=1 Tax=Methanoculleus chikugoensis TaxID=118126 RepID=UPI0006D0CF20|nr:hypothetical protein [Methanoculleus chikugoensis]